MATSIDLSGCHFGRQDSLTFVGIPWNDSKLQRLREWFYWTVGTIQDITIDNTGPVWPRLKTLRLEKVTACLADYAFRNQRKCVSKSVHLTVLLRLSTGVAIHQRSPTHGLDWPALKINGSSGHRRWSRLANISNRWCRLSRPRERILWKLLWHTSYRISA